MAKAGADLLSIGTIGLETGLSPDVLRIWERRYGFPLPVRLPSGHRRYRREDLRRLRLMAEAVAQGHRPSVVAQSSEESLRSLLACHFDPGVGHLVEATASLDMDHLRRLLRAALAELGWRALLQKQVAPFLDRLGMGWADGSLGIHHEHMATEVLEDLLRDVRLACRPVPGKGAVLLATLPGERHRLGLLMAALAYAAEGFRTELLGVDLPVASIAQAARSLRVDRVAVSLSIQSSGETARRLLLDLKERLPAGCRLVVGGQGSGRTRRIEGVERLTGLDVG